MHVVELDHALADIKVGGTGFVRHLLRLLQQVEHFAHIHKALPDFAVDRAKEVQGHGDLDHVGVDHDEIADGQRSVLHTQSCHDHDNDQARGDDQALTEIEHRQ